VIKPPVDAAVAVITCGKFTPTELPAAGAVIPTEGALPPLTTIIETGADVVTFPELSVAKADKV
jgi:hypothetical protein